MPLTPDGPAFGQADLTNCERELIHLAGSVQPHGVLLVLDEASGRILQHSVQATHLLQVPPSADFAGQPLASLNPELHSQVQELAAQLTGDEPATVQCTTAKGSQSRLWEGTLHRNAQHRLVLELEPRPLPDITTVAYGTDELLAQVAQAVQRFSNAASIGVLVDAASKCFRDLIGHDRVMVYKFDADGHGKIVSEARDPRLMSLLGHHYPATDIPQRARQLYLRNRVRVLVDVHYQASPLQPPTPPGGAELDMSMCYLRSMSPLHLQYLKNMGVTATVVVSLVREGQLWGLIAAHHCAPRNISRAVRSACELLGEVLSTRIAAIENYAHAQVAVMVRRLEQRLIEATSTEGDWRMALFRNPGTLLQPLDATGAVLFVNGEILTTGEVPSTPELRELLQWVAGQPDNTLFSCTSVGRANEALDSLTPTASGVLAVRLSARRPDYLVWLRREQLTSVTWAGDPSKPMVANNPMELSPRSSFAAWSETVRGTALPWTSAELAMGRAIGLALVDIIAQVNAVRLLIAEHQLTQARDAVGGSHEALLMANASGQVLSCNAAFTSLTGCEPPASASLQTVTQFFVQPERLHLVLAALRPGQPAWRGEMALQQPDGSAVPVMVRAERVAARDGATLGTIITLFDLRDSKRAAHARRNLEASMQLAANAQALRHAAGDRSNDNDGVITAILTNASLAAMDIADGAVGSPVATLLGELQMSTQRAAALYGQIRGLSEPGPD